MDLPKTIELTNFLLVRKIILPKNTRADNPKMK